MSCPRCVEHECSGSCEHADLRVVVGTFEDIDFLTELGCLANDFPGLARRRFVVRDDRKPMRMLAQDSPPSTILMTVCRPNVVAGSLPLALLGKFSR